MNLLAIKISSNILAICYFDLFCNDVLSIAKLGGTVSVKASHLCVTPMVHYFFWVLEGIITSM